MGVCISGLSQHEKFVRLISVVFLIFIAVRIYVTIPIYLSSLLDGPLGCFLFLSRNIHIFCEHVHAFLFVIYPELELLGQRI